MYKNVANQYVFLFAWDAIACQPKTGDAGNITVYLSKDGGAPASKGNPAELHATNAKGVYKLQLTNAADTNVDVLVISGVSTTSGVQIAPVTIYTREAIMTYTGITAGGTWTYEKLMKICAAWFAGKWQDKSGSPGTYEVLDPDDGSTVILEVTPASSSPQKVVVVKI